MKFEVYLTEDIDPDKDFSPQKPYYKLAFTHTYYEIMIIVLSKCNCSLIIRLLIADALVLKKSVTQKLFDTASDSGAMTSYSNQIETKLMTPHGLDYEGTFAMLTDDKSNTHATAPSGTLRHLLLKSS